MILYHYTNLNSFKEIEQSGSILPLSPRSAIAQLPIFGNFLPQSHKEKGVYGIREKDASKWNSDSFALNHFAQLKSKKEDLVKMVLEVPEEPTIEVLDEGILFYEVLPLAKKYALRDASWRQFFTKLPLIAKEGFQLYDKYADSRVSVTEYRGDYILPSTFVRKAINLQDALKNVEILKYQDIFKEI